MPRTTKKVTTVPNSRRGYMPVAKTDNHPTPKAFYNLLDKEFRFTCDAAASSKNAKCAVFFTRRQNGLAQNWGKHVVFLNPPYGRGIADWAKKALDAASKGATVVMLVPSRTDTKWFRAVVERPEVQVVFVTGRLKFGNAKNAAPFSNVVLVVRPPRYGSQAMKVRFINAA